MQAIINETPTSASLIPSFSRHYSPNVVSPAGAALTDVVYLVDRDPGVLDSISRTLSPYRIRVVGFASTTDYLHHTRTDAAACLILDVDLLNIDLPKLESYLEGKTNPPIVIIGSPGDVTSAVQAMKAGAVEFLTKPIDADTIAAAVRMAFDQDRKLRRKKVELMGLQIRFSRLTPREREVFSLIAGGFLNKQAAAHLGISDITVQIHRGQVMRKMEAESFAALVRFAVKLRIPSWREARKPSESILLA